MQFQHPNTSALFVQAAVVHGIGTLIVLGCFIAYILEAWRTWDGQGSSGNIPEVPCHPKNSGPESLNTQTQRNMLRSSGRPLQSSFGLLCSDCKRCWNCSSLSNVWESVDRRYCSCFPHREEIEICNAWGPKPRSTGCSSAGCCGRQRHSPFGTGEPGEPRPAINRNAKSEAWGIESIRDGGLVQQHNRSHDRGSALRKVGRSSIRDTTADCHVATGL